MLKKVSYIRVCQKNKGAGRHTFIIRRWNGQYREVYTYLYALLVNWCELTITTEEGKVLYKNAFAANYRITDKNVEVVVECGKTRWKVENENNNTLKTKGYHLEHNYGHGKESLSAVLVTFILLSFLFHTLLELMDRKYRLIRKELPSILY